MEISWYQMCCWFTLCRWKITASVCACRSALVMWRRALQTAITREFHHQSHMALIWFIGWLSRRLDAHLFSFGTFCNREPNVWCTSSCAAECFTLCAFGRLRSHHLYTYVCLTIRIATIKCHAKTYHCFAFYVIQSLSCFARLKHVAILRREFSMNFSVQWLSSGKRCGKGMTKSLRGQWAWRVRQLSYNSYPQPPITIAFVTLSQKKTMIT